MVIGRMFDNGDNIFNGQHSFLFLFLLILVSLEWFAAGKLFDFIIRSNVWQVNRITLIFLTVLVWLLALCNLNIDIGQLLTKRPHLNRSIVQQVSVKKNVILLGNFLQCFQFQCLLSQVHVLLRANQCAGYFMR